jgi:hypothetical protein
VFESGDITSENLLRAAIGERMLAGDIGREGTP